MTKPRGSTFLLLFFFKSINICSTEDRPGPCDEPGKCFCDFCTTEKSSRRTISGQRWTPSCLTSWAARSCSRRKRMRWRWAAEIIWMSSTDNIRTCSPANRPSERARPWDTGGAGTCSLRSADYWFSFGVSLCRVSVVRSRTCAQH